MLDLMWQPPEPTKKQSVMMSYIQWMHENYSPTIKDWESLYQYSIYEKDQILTQKDSFVVIQLKTGTTIALGAKSEFIFKQEQKLIQGISSTFYHLLYGQLRAQVIKQTKKQRLKILTPNVAMGIRGTEVLIDVYQLANGVKSNLALLSGKAQVNITDLKIKGHSIITLNPGEYLDTDLAQRFGQVKKGIKKLSKQQLRKLRNSNHSKPIFLYPTIHPQKEFPNPKTKINGKNNLRKKPKLIQKKKAQPNKVKAPSRLPLKNLKSKSRKIINQGPRPKMVKPITKSKKRVNHLKKKRTKKLHRKIK